MSRCGSLAEARFGVLGTEDDFAGLVRPLSEKSEIEDRSDDSVEPAAIFGDLLSLTGEDARGDFDCRPPPRFSFGMKRSNKGLSDLLLAEPASDIFLHFQRKWEHCF